MNEAEDLELFRTEVGGLFRALQLGNVRRICAAVMQCGLEADAMEVYEEMKNMAPAL